MASLIGLDDLQFLDLVSVLQWELTTPSCHGLLVTLIQ